MIELFVDSQQVETLNKFPWAYILLATVVISGGISKYLYSEIKRERKKYEESLTTINAEYKDMNKSSIETLTSVSILVKSRIETDEKLIELLHQLKDKK